MAQSLIRGSTQILDASITAAKFAASLDLPTNQLQDGALFIKSNGTVAMAADWSMGNFKITSLADPVSATDAVNLRTAQSMMAGVGTTARVEVVATTNLSLTGLQTVAGYTLVANDVILLTGQSTASQNGPWVAASGAWTRPTYWAAASTKKPALFYVNRGSPGADTKWSTITDGDIVVDTTSVTITQDTTGSTYTAGNGILLTGSVFSAKLGNALAFDGSNNITITPIGTGLLQVTASGIGITPGTSGQILINNATPVPVWATASGDVSVSDTGAMTVNNTAGSGFVKYSNFVESEIPGGTPNGALTAFTTAFTSQGGIMLYLNGQRLKPGAGNDYTLSGTAITMLFAPQTGDQLLVDYWK